MSHPHPDQGYTVLLPCAGASSRFPGMRPKWLLTTPEGALMVQRSAADIPSDQVERVIIGIRAEHDRAYQAREALQRAFDGRAEVLLLDEETQGPADTVRRMIDAGSVSGPICIKDADSFVSAGRLPHGSFVGAIDLREHPEVRSVGRKSFIVLDERSAVVDVVEKSVVSNFVSIGLYGFQEAEIFARAFDALPRSETEIFVSHVVAQAIREGAPVAAHFVERFEDVGTLADWRRYAAPRKTLFLDIDGVVFRNHSKYFHPLWEELDQPIAGNVALLKRLQESGAQLVFVTARPERYREKTLQALSACGLRVHALVMGCLHGQRVLVNDFAASNPYPTASAVNVPRNADNLDDYLA